MSIVKLNESTLLALGFDLVTARALSHAVRQVGTETGGTTLPEIVEQGEFNNAALIALTNQVSILQEIIALLEIAAANNPHVSTLEQDAQLAPNDSPHISTFLQDLQLSPVAQLEQAVETLQTETRQQAELIAVLTNQIQEIKQGTML